MREYPRFDALVAEHGSRQALWKHLYEYHEDGYLTWKRPRAKRNKIGDIVGSMNTRYFSTLLLEKTIYIHVIVFEYFNGDVPEGLEVDHIDVNSLNNKIENLRIADRILNVRNINVRKDSSSGVTGVFKSGWGYKAQICVDGVQKSLGIHATMEQAIAARKAGEEQYH